LRGVKTNVYVDGFNLYYGAVKGTPYKWLNIRQMCETAFPKNAIAEIHYCTAIVQDAPWDPEQSIRQQTFIRALQSTDVEVHYGSFLSKVVRMPRAKRLPGQSRFVMVLKTEEKGSDVALGSLLVAHGYQGRYEAAIVVSNDSDLVLPIRIVREELGLPVGLLNPHKRFSVELSKAASFRRQIREGLLKSSQFPRTVADEHGTITKPDRW
jgi:NYN domain